MKKIVISSLIVIVASIFLISYTTSQKEAVLGRNNLENVRGLVIPHHDLASELIITTLDGIKHTNEYDTIIIIGPNHFFPENKTILTAKEIYDYQIDEKSIDLLDDQFSDVGLSPKILSKEHSVNIPMKYLSQYYPKAQFIPLIVSPYYSDETIQSIASFLSNKLEGKMLFVLAIDFSHNLGNTEALANNDESIQAIKSFDYKTILSFTDEHMDSPVSTILFLETMKDIGARRWTTLESLHGSTLENISNLNGTSYVLGIFQ